MDDSSEVAAAAALLGGSSVVDCTQVIRPESFSFAGCFFQRSNFAAEDLNDTREEGPGGFWKKRFCMACDVGTHIDAPAHWYKNGRCIDGLRLAELIAPGVVVDVVDKCEKDWDYRLTVEDLEAWESRHGEIPQQAIVVMKTGWGARFYSTKDYLGLDEYDGVEVKGIKHFPGFSEEAALWLLDRKNIKGIGIDTASLDRGMDEAFPVHRHVLGADKFMIENMNLAELPEVGVTFVALPLNVKDAPEAETRVLAVVR
mmetsp:Transcript_12932/g.47914  ORF Transcript_12932/g.47914 Transcript_12932/m.47914 type:complete len:257 (-) Transcript_12932:2233-3003(-)